MPILRDTKIRFDADAATRDVVAVGLKLDKERHESGIHRHRKAQCLMATSGVLTCEADGGIWIVPPHTALWIPPDIDHSVTFAGNVEGYNAFIKPRAIVNRLPPRRISLLI